MSTTNKTNQKQQTKAASPAKKKAAAPAPCQKTPKGAVAEMERMIVVASAWCGDHGVPIKVTPIDAYRLRQQSDVIDTAIAQAGGPEKVPQELLAYSATLTIAADFIMAHGFEHVIHMLVGGKR